MFKLVGFVWRGGYESSGYHGRVVMPDASVSRFLSGVWCGHMCRCAGKAPFVSLDLESVSLDFENVLYLYFDSSLYFCKETSLFLCTPFFDR